MFKVTELINKAKKLNKTIVYPEGETSQRVLSAAEIVLKKKIANVILLGNPQKILEKNQNLQGMGATIIDPKTSELMPEFIEKLVEIRKDKGLTKEEAEQLLTDNFYFASMMVQLGLADGFVGGAETSTSNVLRPALQIIKTKPNIKNVSSCVILVGTKKLKLGENNVVVAGDCGLTINPNAEQLCDIAIATADSAQKFCNITPKVAMLSFSSFGSGGNKDESILKVRQALELIKQKNPEMIVDGEMQLDCALIEDVAKVKAKNSPVAGKANVIIFPDLNSGNIGYKLMERFGKLQAVGVIMQGFNKPINDLSRGCHIYDIVVMTAITVLQTQE